MSRKIKKVIVSILSICIIIAVTFAIYISLKNRNENVEQTTSMDKVEKEEIVEPVVEIQTLTLAMVGDALYHNDVYGDGKNRVTGKEYDYTHNLIHMEPIISKYDLAYYNQETILRGNSNRFIKLSKFQFSARSPEMRL